MAVLLTGRSNSYAQLITVLVVFVAVLGVTAWTTRWIANYQKKQTANCNIQLIEAARLNNNKYIQIVRVGETYIAIAVCKDTVTMLGEIPVDQLKEPPEYKGGQFKELFENAVRKHKSQDSPKE